MIWILRITGAAMACSLATSAAAAPWMRCLNPRPRAEVIAQHENKNADHKNMTSAAKAHLDDGTEIEILANSRGSFLLILIWPPDLTCALLEGRDWHLTTPAESSIRS